ncbi:hypothetical protein O181_087645 [Austropuccinia psidii MF-1]|uniref:Tet-like 2OG-Fe(II) oxygenase domain-containing protein n=1 Tax=Austropuccinia psidii MF-1 TaxID=1389203 RepID=A0A9Q3IQA0_9BASI|nr:hypothetical protein [Austropuccinia psidii MF-1]
MNWPFANSLISTFKEVNSIYHSSSSSENLKVNFDHDFLSSKSILPPLKPIPSLFLDTTQQKHHQVDQVWFDFANQVKSQKTSVSVHHQNNLNDDETIVPPIDVMVRTKPEIEHHEDNNNQTNHKRKLTQCQRQHIHDSKQIMSQLGNSKTAYKNFSTILIYKKSANASWLKLPSINTLPHPYVLINRTHKPFLPFCIYEISPFDVSSDHSQILKDLIITLISLSQNCQEIRTNEQLLHGIMKGIGFCPGSDAGVYSSKAVLSPHQIELDNMKWTKLQKYDKFIYSRISHFSQLAAQENRSLMEAAQLPNFSQLELISANLKDEFKSFSTVIFTQDGFFNKPNQDLNDLNACTYGIFSFVSKKDFHPLPTVFTPSGHGLHFPKLKMEINFSKKPGIMEILWKTSTMVHHTTKPPPEMINHDKVTHFGCSEKFLKMTPTKINSRVNGYFERNMQDKKRTKKYQL